MADQRVAPEVALQEFERMCSARRVDIDESKMSEEDRESFVDLRDKIVSAIVAGSLVVADDGTPTYTTRDGKSLTFYPATGATFMAADDVKEGKNVRKTVAMMTEMTRSEQGTFAKLEAPDFKVCLSLGQLFLA